MHQELAKNVAITSVESLEMFYKNKGFGCIYVDLNPT